jgi:hypothetical protein
MEGESAAIDAAAKKKVRKFMMVFLVWKIPTPHKDTSARRSAFTNEKLFYQHAVCLMYRAIEPLGDPALAQDPARQFLQILARAILRPVQEVVALIGGQLGFE